MEKNKLEEFYGLLMNYINGQKDISDWDKLTEFQKKESWMLLMRLNRVKEFPTKLSLINSERNTQMPKPILWSPLAEDDFANILDYLDKHWGNKVVNNFIDLTENLLILISENPKQYPLFHKRKGLESVYLQSTILCSTEI
ncbi:MAG: type II toxin-antitoxin system RelE/ParE family toxin [Bacteroidales bacterium]|nr:type II toxin-antitoxin system RelE/ParE family toxin [Bacteroidales bacterium]